MGKVLPLYIFVTEFYKRTREILIYGRAKAKTLSKNKNFPFFFENETKQYI